MSTAFRQERLMTVIRGPHLSEKGYLAAATHNQYAFKVRIDATKAEIRDAVKLLFEVDVTDVNVVRYHGKVKRFGRSSGRRDAWKKAYVKVADGQTIEGFGAE
jgi:large subunit ribosomal protein L23